MHPVLDHLCFSSRVKCLLCLTDYLVETLHKYWFNSEYKGNNKAIMLFLCYTQLNPALYLLPYEKSISLEMLFRYLDRCFLLWAEVKGAKVH